MNETLDACESIIVPESRRGVDYCSNTTLDITRSKKGIPNKPTNQPTILSGHAARMNTARHTSTTG